MQDELKHLPANSDNLDLDDTDEYETTDIKDSIKM